MARDRPGPFFVSAPAGCEIYITLTYNDYDFQYAFPLSGRGLLKSEIFELSVDGRSMFLIEGTATGSFDFGKFAGNVNTILSTVTPDGGGNFSALLPFTDYPHFFANGTMTSISRVPDYFDLVTNASNMFANNTALTSICYLPFGNCTNMRGMFDHCTSLVAAPEMDTKNVTNMIYMFSYCSSLKSVPSYDTRSLNAAEFMFYYCTALTDLEDFDVSHVSDFRGMFYNCSSLVNAPNLDTSNGKRFMWMYRGCTKMESIPQYDTHNGTNFNGMFQDCNALKSMPLMDTSNGTDFTAFMKGCSTVKSLPLFDFSSAVTMSSAFDSCTSLESIPDFEFPEATNVSNLFNLCRALTTVQTFSFPKATNASGLFGNCTAVVAIGILDLPKCTNVRSIFYNCTKLSSDPLRSLNDCTDFTTSYYGCSSLTDFYHVDYSKATAMSGCWHNTNIATLPYITIPLNTTFEGMVSSPYLVSIAGLDMSNYRSTMGNPFISLIKSEKNRKITGLTYIGALDGLSDDLDISMVPNLTRQSLVAIFNSIANVSDPKTLTIGTDNLGRLSASDQAIATNKGWVLQ